MLFANLAALIAKGVTVQFTVLAAADGKLEVNVIPSVTGGSSDLNLVPKSFVGSAEELDAEFPDVIAGYTKANLTLMQQLEDVKIVADAAGREAAEKAAAAAANKKPPAARTSAARKPAAPAAPTLETPDDETSDDDGDDTPEGSEAGTTTAAPTGGSEPIPFTL